MFNKFKISRPAKTKLVVPEKKRLYSTSVTDSKLKSSDGQF